MVGVERRPALGDGGGRRIMTQRLFIGRIAPRDEGENIPGGADGLDQRIDKCLRSVRQRPDGAQRHMRHHHIA